MIRRLAAVTAAGVALLTGPAVLGAGLAGPVSAATPAPSLSPTPGYPTRTAPGAVTKATVLVGGQVGFSGGGFRPGSAVAISELLPGGGTGHGQTAVVADSVLTTVTASAGGAFGITLTLTVLGVTTLIASGTAANGSPLTDVAVVTVSPRSKGTGGSKSPSPSSSASSGSSPGASASGTGGAGGGNGGGGGSGAGGAGGGSGGLPKTGADGIAPELWLGGGLVVVGGAAVAVGVSRRRTRVRP